MSDRPFLPVAEPSIGELEVAYVHEAVASGWVSSIGAFVDRFERDFAAFCGTDHAVAISNGTDALFLALRALGIGPGDEVVIPALTFAAVGAVVVHAGATPVLVDVHPDHWNLDPVAVERALTPQTKAVIAVHLYGHPADMDPLVALCRPRSIALIEDAAEAHGARYKGRTVGSLGDVGSFSFYGNKVITTGEGGALVSDDADLLARVRHWKDHAMDPNRRYFHLDAGYNCRMTNLQAALGVAQLERAGELLAWRADLMQAYRDALADVPGLTLNPHLDWADPVNWLVCAVLDPALAGERDRLLAALRAEGIDTRPFFVPMADLPPYAGCRVVGAEGDDAPVARWLGDAGFNLPTSERITPDDVARIADALRHALTSVAA